jgi:hypothetical protein
MKRLPLTHWTCSYFTVLLSLVTLSTASFEAHPSYTGVEGDAKDVALLKDLLAACDHLVAGAAIIGGISLFRELACDLLSENERITAATSGAAIWAHRNAGLRKITVLASSMVYESTATSTTMHQLAEAVWRKINGNTPTAARQ